MRGRTYLSDPKSDEGELVAGFGEAKLVRTIEGKYELRGGSQEDREAARKWVAMFFHAVVKEA